MFGDSSLGGAVNEIKGATIDWIERIRDFLTGSMKTLSSWNRLNKRHAWRGINLPSQIGVNSGGEIAIAIDTSGSVSQPELDYIAQVVQLICEELGIEKVRVCYCDTRVHKNSDGEWWDKFDLSQNEDLEFKVRGGGGTHFDPPFNLFNEHSDDVDDVCAFLYFTDGWGEVSADESQGGNGDSDVSEEAEEKKSSTGKYSSDDGSAGDDEQSSTGESKYDNIPTLVGEVLDAQNEDGSAKSQAELDELE